MGRNRIACAIYLEYNVPPLFKKMFSYKVCCPLININSDSNKKLDVITLDPVQNFFLLTET